MCDVKGRGKKVKMPILVKDCRKKSRSKMVFGVQQNYYKKITSRKKTKRRGKERETRRTSLEKHIDKKRDVKFIEAKKGKQTNKKNIKW